MLTWECVITSGCHRLTQAVYTSLSGWKCSQDDHLRSSITLRKAARRQSQHEAKNLFFPGKEQGGDGDVAKTSVTLKSNSFIFKSVDFL